MMKIVVFMDFDGVLHPQPCGHETAFCCLHLVEDVLREFQHSIEIVVSSSWRDHHSLEELQEMFPEDLRHLVVGVTPSIVHPAPEWVIGGSPAWEREFEIETWLKGNRTLGTPWLALDDRQDWFREGSPNLLRTKGSNGFEVAQQQTLRAMLHQRKDEL
jgi:hypothetical protein